MLRALRSAAEELFFKGEAQIFFTLQNMSMWCCFVWFSIYDDIVMAPCNGF